MEENEKSDVECPTCNLRIGLNIAFSICEQNKDIDCKNIERKLENKEITVKQALDEIKKGLKKEDTALIDELEELMIEKK